MLGADELARLLSALIRAESPDPPGDERRIVKVLASEMQALGLTPEIEEFAPRRYNVLARVSGAGARPALVFSAHMDTLPAGNGDWHHPPFAGHVDGGHVHGRGAADMKSGLVAMLAAAAALAAEGPLAGDLILAFTGGESSNCLGARHLAQTRALEGSGAILVSEPSTLEVITAEMSALWLRVTAHGQAGHTSGGENAGRNAIEALTGALPLIAAQMPDAEHELLGRATLNIGRIDGGTAINLTPDRCTAELDLRLLPGQAPEAVEAAIAAVLGPGFDLARLDFKPAVETDPGHPFVRHALRAAGAEHGREMAPRGAAYFSDACILSPAFGLPMVIIGPGGLGHSGSLNERVAISDVAAAARIFTDIARRLLG